MKASFVFKEMVYNSICKDKIIYVDGEQKIIDYVKCVPRSGDVQLHFTNGDIHMANESHVFDFEVNNKLQWKKANKRQIQQSKTNL
mgnify:CR=1 FL=1